MFIEFFYLFCLWSIIPFLIVYFYYLSSQLMRTFIYISYFFILGIFFGHCRIVYIVPIFSSLNPFHWLVTHECFSVRFTIFLFIFSSLVFSVIYRCILLSLFYKGISLQQSQEFKGQYSIKRWSINNEHESAIRLLYS